MCLACAYIKPHTCILYSTVHYTLLIFAVHVTREYTNVININDLVKTNLIYAPLIFSFRSLSLFLSVTYCAGRSFHFCQGLLVSLSLPPSPSLLPSIPINLISLISLPPFSLFKISHTHTHTHYTRTHIVTSKSTVEDTMESPLLPLAYQSSSPSHIRAISNGVRI